jgi:hypothetical protein
MKHFTPFRIAAYLTLLFCAGHTAGGMLAQKSLGPASDAVFAAMKSTHFEFNGADSTWYGFWFGFGLTVSVFLLLVAATALVLDRVTPDAWPQVRVIAWALVAAMAFNGIMAWRYFFAGPVVFSVVITALLVVGATRKASARGSLLERDARAAAQSGL